MYSGMRSITFSAISCEVVKSQPGDSCPCSICPTKSIATTSGSAFSSAITATSDGPANTSMPTSPKRVLLASATNLFPGPTMISAFFPVNNP